MLRNLLAGTALGVKEIGDRLGVSRDTTQNVLMMLISAGDVVRTDTKPARYRLTVEADACPVQEYINARYGALYGTLRGAGHD
jgi:DNA-binding IclR family transcriptional regulator